MATIASLNVYLNAQTEGFSKGVESATRETVRFMMQLDQQARTIGMTADEAKLYNLEMRGVEKALIDTARQTLNQVNALKQQQSATDAAKKLTTELQIQAATFRMTANEAAIYRLQLQGATKDSIEAARAAAKLADAQGGGAFGSTDSKGFAAMLKGGGQLLIFQAIAQSIKNITGAIVEVTQSTENWAGKTQLLLRSLPILKEIEAAGANINEIFTGTKKMLELENERTKQLDSQIAKVNELRDARIKAEQEVAKIAAETIRQGQQMTAENDAARMKAVEQEAKERQKFADAMEKSRREQVERQRRIEQYAIDAARKKEQERLNIEEKSLKKQLELSKAAESALPKEMRFATATLATGSNMGIGDAFRNAMSIDFGNDRSKVLEKLNKEQLEIQRKIEENTRRQGSLSTANFN